MKKVLSFIILFALVFSFAGCDSTTTNDDANIPSDITSNFSEYNIDYSDAKSFESALNDGIKVKGKIVRFDVIEYKPNSAMGFNCWSGEHLNFISETELDVEKGDVVIGRITKEPSKSFGSWKVPYEVLEIEDKKTESQENDTESSKESSTELKNTAGAPDVWMNLFEKHYKEVKKQFEDAGFTNIICVAHEIDYNENNTFEGSVVNIAIGENGEICTFEKGEQWKKDNKIRIDYRVKPVKENSSEVTKTDSSQTQSNGGNSTGNSGVTVPNQEENKGNLVWVPTNGGTKYHSKSSCSGMKNPMQVSVETAKSNGYTPCARCH